MLHSHGEQRMNILIIAAGALAAVATALVVRGRQTRRAAESSTTSVGPVSEEWLSNARGQGDQSW
jgi:hypothetical protein